jgi:hypothetical protein
VARRSARLLSIALTCSSLGCVSLKGIRTTLSSKPSRVAFAPSFGRTLSGSASANRRPTISTSRPLSVSIKSQFATAHPIRWKEYQELANAEKRKYFEGGTSHVYTLLAHVEGDRAFSFTVDKDIIETIVLEMYSGSSVGDDAFDSYPDAPALDAADTFLPTSICRLKDENGETSCTVAIRKNKQFALTRRVIRAGVSFRATSRILKDIADVTGVSVASAGLSCAKVSIYVKVAIAFGVQAIADAMRETWGYSAAFYCATYHSTTYMDIRVRLFRNDAIVNLHLLALPMFERHSGEYIFDLFNRLLSVLDPNWRQKIVGVTTDGAANMTGSDSGAVSRIERETFQGFYRAWCGLHQLVLTQSA